MESIGRSNTVTIDKDLFRIAVRALEIRVVTGHAFESEIDALNQIEQIIPLWKH